MLKCVFSISICIELETEKSNQQNDLRMGGCLLFNTSKASVNPGPGFGPYAVAKAATLALMKQVQI
jgi:hypothetical protein